MKAGSAITNKWSYFLYLCTHLFIAGSVVGLLHKHQWIVFTFISSYLAQKLYRVFLVDSKTGWFYTVGACITMFLGITAELWGTYYNHWTYHEIPTHQLIPVWLPLAWACVFSTAHQFETFLAFLTNYPKVNFLLMTGSVVVVTTVIEYAPIYMNVWTYHWPYKLFNVPAVATILNFKTNRSIGVT